MSVSMPVELETDGTVGTLAKQVAWLLGGEVEVTYESHENGLHIVLKDIDYDMSQELFSTKEEED